MRILIDIGHPAHVHLFKNFIFYLKKEKIDYVVVSRNKEITNNLLQHYNISFDSISNPGKNLFEMIFELLKRTWKIFKINKKSNFSLALGTSVSIGLLSKFTKPKVISWNFSEDDDYVIPLYAKIANPFSTKIINPTCILFDKWESKRVFVPSYHELAYLHPDNFQADEKVLQKYGLEKYKFVIFRLSALKAHHDKGAKGISFELNKKLKMLVKNYDIIESNEGKKGGKIDPWDIHHVLAFSKMLISDSQTMSIEAAVLGIPSIRINSFIDKSTLLSELQDKYNLTFGFFPEDELNILTKINELLEDKMLTKNWEDKKLKLLEDKIDFNMWLIDYFESNYRK